MTAASLTALLSGWPDHRLHRLLQLRPDLVHPPVPDLAALAARASTQASILRALDRLDRAHLDVLEALAVLGASPNPPESPVSAGTRYDAGRGTSRARLAAFLRSPAASTTTSSTDHPERPGRTEAEPASGPEPLGVILADLAAAALVVPGHPDGADAGTGATWLVPVAVETALGPHPLGLGRPLAVLDPALPTDLPRDRAGIRRLINRHADDPALRSRLEDALDALQDSPVTRLPEPAGPVHRLLLDTALLVPSGRLPDGTALAEHPAEAGLAWRDGTAGRTLDTAPPPPAGRTVPAALSANAGLAAITDLLRAADDLLSALDGGLATLRSSGVGVRELKRLTESSGATAEDAAWLLELLAAAGLVVLDPDTSRWTVASAARGWQRGERALQWETLVLGWLHGGRAPMLGPALPGPGLTPTSSGAVPPGRALAPDRNRPDAPRLRAGVLETALELDRERPGARLDQDVARRRAWRNPRQDARTVRFTAPLLAEAARLGLTGAGALTEAGLLVAAGRLEEAAAVVGTSLPAPVLRVRLQGDLTAVAPGYLDPEVARGLAAMADAEGDGAARVYRFSDASLHRALDAGLDATGIEEFLSAHSEDEVPQSLRYLVRDVARRHGALAVGAAASWLRVEDEAQLDVLLADPALAGAGLVRVGPTAAVAGIGQDDLHGMLAVAGHRAARLPAPGPEESTAAEASSDGWSTGDGRPGASLSSAFPDPVRAVRWTPSEEELVVQVARLRSAPAPAPTGPGTEDAVALLRHAARHRTPVRLTTVDHRGRRSAQRVVPLAVAGGRVRALVPEREAETVIPLHRVVSAEPENAPTQTPEEDPCPTDR